MAGEVQESQGGAVLGFDVERGKGESVRRVVEGRAVVF